MKTVLYHALLILDDEVDPQDGDLFLLTKGSVVGLGAVTFEQFIKVPGVLDSPPKRAITAEDFFAALKK